MSEGTLIEQGRTLARAFMDGQFPNKKAAGVLIKLTDTMADLFNEVDELEAKIAQYDKEKIAIGRNIQKMVREFDAERKLLEAQNKRYRKALEALSNEDWWDMETPSTAQAFAEQALKEDE